MPAPRGQRDEETGLLEDSPTAKRPKSGGDARSPLTRAEMAAAAAVFLLFSSGLVCVYLTMPEAEFRLLRLPRSLSDLRVLKENVAVYAKNYQGKFLLGYCAVYIFMQTFMIPGTIFLSLLAGSLFGVVRGVMLVVFSATSGASSCYFLSKLIGRPLVSWLWPEKLRFFQAEIVKRKDRLLNYMLFLRITPTLPNTFINVASPIVDIPFHIFFFATIIGLIPASYITVRAKYLHRCIGRVEHQLLQLQLSAPVKKRMLQASLDLQSGNIQRQNNCTVVLGELNISFCSYNYQAGLALGELRSVRDLYDLKTLVVLFLIGFVSILPAIIKRKRTYE